MQKPINKPKSITEDNPNLNQGTNIDSIENEGLNKVDSGNDLTIDDDLGDTIIKDEIIIDITDIDFEPRQPPPIQEPIEPEIKQEYQYEYDPNRSYLFIFGPPSAGKTVLIGSIIKYLKVYRSQKHGDTLKNKNNSEIKHEYEGNRLWRELTEANIQNKFPTGTQAIAAAKAMVNLPVPRHINLHFHPASSHPDFEFCFMDLSGEDCSKIDYESGGKLHWSIRTYLEDVPKKNMCFIYVLDPKCEQKTNDEQTALFEAFIDTLDSNEHTSTPVLILVSKWDLYKNSYNNVEEYLKTEFEDIWGVANQSMRNISYAEFSIGEVEKERNERILCFDPSYPERVFNWFYKTKTGKSLSVDNESEKELSLWDKIMAFFRK